MDADLDYVPRGRHRLKLFQPGTVRVSRDLLRVHVLNISLTGALVHRDQPPPPGTLLDIRIGGMERRASVAWASGARFGIQFQIPLTESELHGVIAHEAADVAERRRNHIV